MKGKYIGIIAFVSVIVLLMASCNLGTPDLALRVINPSYQIIGSDVQITFKLYNSGSEALQDCKVKWFVDDTSGADIEYDEITSWAPSGGVDLGVDQTSAVLSVYTTAVNFTDGVNFYGIYEMGWNYSSDE